MSGQSVYCQVVVSTYCPCSLVGQDLLSQLHLGVIPHDKGLTVVRMKNWRLWSSVIQNLQLPGCLACVVSEEHLAY